MHRSVEDVCHFYFSSLSNSLQGTFEASSQLRHCVRLLTFAILCTSVASEDYASANDDDTEDAIVFPEESSPACIIFFSLMFGFFIILFGAVIGYFSYMEDSLMRTYIKEGDLVEGDVVSAEFARGGGQVGGCSNKRAIAEYITFVEYSRELSTNYTVRVRKQMKAKETDFVKRLVPGSSAMLKSLKSQGEGSTQGEEEEIECDGYVDIGPIHQPSRLGCADMIELYVLPEFPTSALPRRQVERSCGIRNRLSTFALIVIDLALAGFCTRFAAEALVDLTDVRQERIDLYAVLMLATLIVVQVPFVQLCMRGWLWNVLLEEYLESGDFIPIQRDDSSLSTGGSDAFLTMSPTDSVTFDPSFSFQ